MKITYKALQAAILCVAKNDVRQYLHGVHVTGQNVSATDGHILFNYDESHLYNNNDLNIIIPSEAITNFIKHIGKKIDFTTVELESLDDGYILQYNEIKCFFRSIDGKFPDVGRVIRDVPMCEDLKIQQIMFNLEYMSLSQKINKTLNLGRGVNPLCTFNGSSLLMTWEQDAKAKLVVTTVKQR